MKFINILLIGLAIGLVKCQSKSKDPSNNQQNEIAHQNDGGNKQGHRTESDFRKVHLTPEKLQSIELDYDTLQHMTLKSNVKTNGRMTIAPDDKSKISTLIEGRVKKIDVIEGDYVQRGRTLVLLEGTKITHMQKKYLKNREKLPYLKKDYERKKRLLKEKVGAARELQKARSAYQSTRAEVQSLEQNLKMLHIFNEVKKGKIVPFVPVVAPFSGHIGAIKINRGEFVESRQSLMEIINTDKVHIDLNVYEKDIHNVKEGQTILFNYANQPGPWVQGRIFRVGKKYHRENEGVKVHASINEPEKVNLVPGIYVNAQIQVRNAPSYALPENAVIRDGNKTYVFAPASAVNENGKNQQQENTQHEDGRKRFVRIPVIAGTTESGYTAIAFNNKEIPLDIRFVTKGAYFLQAEMKKSVGDHHH